MKAFYILLGCIVWNRVIETVKRIQSMSDEEFNRMVQAVLGKSVRPVAEGTMDKVCVTHGRCRYVLNRKNDGTLKLEKTTTTKEIKEA